MSEPREIYEMIIEYMNSRNMKYEAHDEEMYVSFMTIGDDLPQPTVIRVDDKRMVVQIYSPIPARIKEEKIIDAAVAVAKTNNGMVNGNFQLDLDLGTITFVMTQIFLGTEFNEDVLSYMMAICVTTTDRFNDKFFMLNNGMLSLEQFMNEN